MFKVVESIKVNPSRLVKSLTRDGVTYELAVGVLRREIVVVGWIAEDARAERVVVLGSVDNLRAITERRWWVKVAEALEGESPYERPSQVINAVGPTLPVDGRHYTVFVGKDCRGEQCWFGRQVNIRNGDVKFVNMDITAASCPTAADVQAAFEAIRAAEMEPWWQATEGEELTAKQKLACQILSDHLSRTVLEFREKYGLLLEDFSIDYDSGNVRIDVEHDKK